MKVTVCDEVTNNKKVEFEKNIWSGKTLLKYDGVTMHKKSRNKYSFIDSDNEQQLVLVNGNEITGISLQFNNGSIQILRKLSFFEIILALIPLYLVIIGGAIGGALGGLSAVCIGGLCRMFNNIFLKILIAVSITGIATGIWYIVAKFILEVL